MPHVSRHMSGIEPSDIRKWTSIIEQAGGINLAQGNCFIEPAPYFGELIEATLQAIIKGKTATGYNTYAHTSGVTPLREAIAKKTAEFNGFHADPSLQGGNITVTAGATGGMQCTLHAIMDPGDQIILFEPYYNYHLKAILMQSGVPRFAHLRGEAWDIDVDELESLITDRTRAVIVNTPNNPTGKVFSREELEAIGRVCQRHGLHLVCDEVYEFITFDGKEHVSAASIEEIASSVITIGAFSKTLAITGWRVGYVIAPPEVSRRVRIANEMDYVCAPTPLQHGVAKLVDRWECFSELKERFAPKRAALCGALADAGFGLRMPEGAYYVLADCSILGSRSDMDTNVHLIETYRIAGVPGSAFFDGQSHTGRIRFCFAIPDAELDSLPHLLRAPDTYASDGGPR